MKWTNFYGEVVDEETTPEVVRRLAVLIAFSQTGQEAQKGWWNYVNCAREALRVVREETADDNRD